MGQTELQSRVEALQSSYLDQGVTFDIGGEERAFPLDVLPRVIEMDQWTKVEAGVQQRVHTLEKFLADVYDAGRVLDDGVVPRRVVTTSSHFHRAAAGIEPPNGVRVHVSGIDLIRDDQGEFRVLEDNVRVPSGVSYVMTNRRAIAAALPETFAEHRIRPVAGYPAEAAHRAARRRSGRCHRPQRRGAHARASSTAPTSSTRCWPARWASSWSRVATSSAAAAA